MDERRRRDRINNPTGSTDFYTSSRLLSQQTFVRRFKVVGFFLRRLLLIKRLPCRLFSERAASSLSSSHVLIVSELWLGLLIRMMLLISARRRGTTNDLYNERAGVNMPPLHLLRALLLFSADPFCLLLSFPFFSLNFPPLFFFFFSFFFSLF